MNSCWNWHQNVPWNSQEQNATGIQSPEDSLILKFIFISMNVHSHGPPVHYMANLGHCVTHHIFPVHHHHLSSLLPGPHCQAHHEHTMGQAVGVVPHDVNSPPFPLVATSPPPIHRHVTTPPSPRTTMAHPPHCSPHHQGPSTATSPPCHLLGQQ